MDVKISKWGNSQGIRIPLPVLEQMGLNNPVGESVSLTVEHDGTVTLRRKVETFADLFKDANIDEIVDGYPNNGVSENRLSGKIGNEDSLS